jgi:predicted nucleic acid-binding protein
VYVVDASVWVSLLMPSDTNHPPSQLWMESVVERGEPIAGPAVVLAEVAGAIARRTGDGRRALKGNTLLRSFPNFRLASVGEELAKLGAETAAQQKLRGVDALYTALAERLGLILITWDEEQRARSRTIVEAFTPQEALARAS